MPTETVEGQPFLFPVPAYALADTGPATECGESGVSVVMLRCPEYPRFLPLFTDRDLADQMLERLAAPGKAVVELSTLPLILDLLDSIEKGSPVRDVGIDVSNTSAGAVGVFVPIRRLIESLSGKRFRTESVPGLVPGVHDDEHNAA